MTALLMQFNGKWTLHAFIRGWDISEFVLTNSIIHVPYCCRHFILWFQNMNLHMQPFSSHILRGFKSFLS